MAKKKKRRPQGASSSSPSKKAPSPNNPFLGLADLKGSLPKDQAALIAREEAAKKPPPPPVTDDDRTFLSAMEGVARDGYEDFEPPGSGPLPEIPLFDESSEVMGELSKLVGGEAPFTFNASDAYIEASVDGLHPKMLRHLKRGDYALQGHLDLHGFTWEEARDKVKAFISSAFFDGKRCVLIVHGKGLHSKDRIPVIKEKLKGWLTRSGIARHVLAICSALPVDGGLGALYVLLRKNRGGERPQMRR